MGVDACWLGENLVAGLCGRDLNCFHFLFEAESKVMTCLEGEVQGLLVIKSRVEEDMGRSHLSRSMKRPGNTS